MDWIQPDEISSRQALLDRPVHDCCQRSGRGWGSGGPGRLSRQARRLRRLSYRRTGYPPFAGGLAINSPAGTIYSTNITPDPEFGIGNYSYEDFSRAVREGIAKGERRLYPAMPYPSFAAISDSDVRALYAYFMKGVKAVNQKPRETALPFPFNQRWIFRFWNAAFAKRERYQPKADRSEKWNRGAYLVQALSHCGACHTPRGLAYQEKAYSESSPDYLSGAVIDKWFAGT